jgi:DNA-binding MarR family transcriptional regulator
MREDMQQGLTERGLTQARAQLLWELKTHQPLTQRALADVLKVSPRNVTALVDALEGDGFVIRTPHPTDRRATLLALSETGELAVRRLDDDMTTLAELLFADVAPADLETFSRITVAAAQRLSDAVNAG